MRILEDAGLAAYTTLGVGGAARFFAEAHSEAEVMEGVAFARSRELRLFILGGGSNLLVADEGFDGLVLRIAARGVREDADGDAVLLEAAAGEGWDDVVRYAVERGYAGMECLAGIPGDAGGTPVQNVGAYGQEVAETIMRVRALDLHAGVFVDLDHADCGFGYRRSIFNSEARGRYAVTAVSYRLRPGGAPTVAYADVRRQFASKLDAGVQPSLREVYDAIREIRAGKGMLAGQGGPDSRSAGSFFKNPVVPETALAMVAEAAGIAVADLPCYPAGLGTVKLPAAWLVEHAGFAKGFALGRAAISTRHTLALVNLGGATCAEIVALRDAIARGVEERFAIRLEQEPVMLS